jgi:hypothetical protein
LFYFKDSIGELDGLRLLVSPTPGRVQGEEREDGKREIIRKPEGGCLGLTDDPPVVGIDLLV